MRVFVTGAEGFVGGYLVPLLTERGHEVAGSVMREREPGESRAECELMAADLRDSERLREIFSSWGPEVIVHLGGLSHVGTSWQRMAEYFQVNVLGTENVLREAPEGCRVILASSAEVYGKVPEEEQPIRESRPPAPMTPYGLTKAAAERLALEDGATVVRSFNLIGAGQTETFALPSFARQLAEIEAGHRENVLRVGNLTAYRDFLDVRDGAEGYAKVVEAGGAGEVYNLSSGQALSISEALELLLEVSGVEVRVEQDPDRMRPSDNPYVTGHPGRLEGLGWKRRREPRDAIETLWRRARERVSGGAA